MFIAERTAYTAPVTSPAELLRTQPDLESKDRVDQHLLTVKSYNSPVLLERSLGSLSILSEDRVTPIVVDDSSTTTFRAENAEVASEFGAEYVEVRGDESLVTTFSDFIAETEAPDTARQLTTYLRRIVTDYPRDPQESWGGVGGAQNMAHLTNVMIFGESQTSPDEWLSTFIDHDVVLPPDAEDIFRLISMYHHLGNVGLITSSYLHHPGSPIRLGTQALQHLAEHEHEMSADEVDLEMKLILQRTPTVGLETDDRAKAKYSTPGPTLDFPTGNYTLSGNRGFDVPVSIVGLEDRGFSAMLQLFVGASKLGVARVPGFLHMRSNEEEAVNGQLTDYFSMAKHATHTAFMGRLLRYALADEQLVVNAPGLMKMQIARTKGQLAGLRRFVVAIGELSQRERFSPYVETLDALRRGSIELGRAVTGQPSESALDPTFADALIEDMRTLHPRLIERAYEFGADGRLGDYQTNLGKKASTDR